MASQAQIRANRSSAPKSTGPRPARGKATMRRNALEHGMAAAHVVSFDEVRTDFERFYEGLAQDFAPEVTAACAAMLARRSASTRSLLLPGTGPQKS